MNLPNVITIMRILLVPLTVWLLLSSEFLLAFVAFIAAGVSDAVDGFIARRYQLRTELGAYLDPLADKVLLVSIYVTLGQLMKLPVWLVILVVSRDVLIVGAVILSRIMDRPVRMRPLFISKVNTALQIALACAVLANLGFDLRLEMLPAVGAPLVGALTAGSWALYMREWVSHMANGNGRSHAE
jgi:cardiolipin synthase